MPSRPTCGTRCIQSLRVEISRQLRYRQFRRIIGEWPEVELDLEVELHTLVDTQGARIHRNRKVDAPFLEKCTNRLSVELPQTSLVVSALSCRGLKRCSH